MLSRPVIMLRRSARVLQANWQTQRCLHARAGSAANKCKINTWEIKQLLCVRAWKLVGSVYAPLFAIWYLLRLFKTAKHRSKLFWNPFSGAGIGCFLPRSRCLRSRPQAQSLDRRRPRSRRQKGHFTYTGSARALHNLLKLRYQRRLETARTRRRSL